MKKRILSVQLLIGILMIMLSINVFAEDSHTHCICGASHTSVGDHTDEASVVWTEWDGKSSIVTDEAYLYLSSDVVLDSPLTVGDGTKLYLCLHGYDITLNSGVAGSVITVQSGGILNLCDCVGTGKVIGINERTDSAPGGAVYILSGGRFNLYSGIITDSIVTNKYGDLDVYNCGTFNMYGGTVTGNNCAQYKNTSNKLKSTPSLTRLTARWWALWKLSTVRTPPLPKSPPRPVTSPLGIRTARTSLPIPKSMQFTPSISIP